MDPARRGVDRVLWTDSLDADVRTLLGDLYGNVTSREAVPLDNGRRKKRFTVAKLSNATVARVRASPAARVPLRAPPPPPPLSYAPSQVLCARLRAPQRAPRGGGPRALRRRRPRARGARRPGLAQRVRAGRRRRVRSDGLAANGDTARGRHVATRRAFRSPRRSDGRHDRRRRPRRPRADRGPRRFQLTRGFCLLERQPGGGRGGMSGQGEQRERKVQMRGREARLRRVAAACAATADAGRLGSCGGSEGHCGWRKRGGGEVVLPSCYRLQATEGSLVPET